MTVKEAVEFLQTKRILSAPVLDVELEAKGAKWQDKYIGILDVSKRTHGLVQISSSSSVHVHAPEHGTQTLDSRRG